MEIFIMNEGHQFPRYERLKKCLPSCLAHPCLGSKLHREMSGLHPEVLELLAHCHRNVASIRSVENTGLLLLD